MSVSDDEDAMMKMNLKIVYDGVGAREGSLFDLKPNVSSAMTVGGCYILQPYCVWTMIVETSLDIRPSHPCGDLE